MQLGVHVNVNDVIDASVEGGFNTYDVLSGKVSTIDGFTSGNIQEHNFINVQASLVNPNIGIGAGVDRVYNAEATYSGISTTDGQTIWKGQIPFKSFGNSGIHPNSGSVLNRSVGLSLGSEKTSEGKTFVGLNIGAGIKAILGIEFSLKIGVNF